MFSASLIKKPNVRELKEPGSNLFLTINNITLTCHLFHMILNEYMPNPPLNRCAHQRDLPTGIGHQRARLALRWAHLLHLTMAMLKIILFICLTSACGFAMGADGAIGSGRDSSFGRDGIVTLSITDSIGAKGIALQPDGKIIAVGFSSDRNYRDKFATVRFHHDGALDQSFGEGGVALTAIGANGHASAIAIQPDGQIVVVGYSVTNETTGGITLVRYKSDGTLDRAFGKKGIAVPPVGNRFGSASAIAIQLDGKIIIGGGINIGGFDDFAIACYNPDGTPDQFFGNGGLVTTAIDKAGDRASAIAIQPDGKIIAVGLGKGDEKNHFALARYHPNGTLDPTFGKQGVVKKSFGKGDSFARALVIQPDGKIVAIGDSSTDPAERYQYTPVFSLTRFNQNGSIDQGFGTDGEVTTSIGSSTSLASSAAVQSDGKIVVAGSAIKAIVDHGRVHRIIVARYTSDGVLDETFGTGGSATTEVGLGTDTANAIAIQSDGKILTAGISRNGTHSDLAIIRYLP